MLKVFKIKEFYGFLFNVMLVFVICSIDFYVINLNI